MIVSMVPLAVQCVSHFIMYHFTAVPDSYLEIFQFSKKWTNKNVLFLVLFL